MPQTSKRDQPVQRLRHQESAKPDPTALSELLDEWMHGDEIEQKETFEVLRRAIDENRPEGYKLFA
jgi:hypothetical protein